MKSTLPVTPDSYIPLSSHNNEITQTSPMVLSQEGDSRKQQKKTP